VLPADEAATTAVVAPSAAEAAADETPAEGGAE
jgi:hypothetical protein